jgi:hypothetical protein
LFWRVNGTRPENGTRPVDEIFCERHRTSSRSNATRNVTSTSNVLVKKRFTTGARRCLECEKIHDVDEQDVYRTCIGGSTRVPDVHRRVKIRCGSDPRAVHDRVPDVVRHHPRPVEMPLHALNSHTISPFVEIACPPSVSTRTAKHPTEYVNGLTIIPRWSLNLHSPK